LKYYKTKPATGQARFINDNSINVFEPLIWKLKWPSFFSGIIIKTINYNSTKKKNKNITFAYIHQIFVSYREPE